MSAIEEKTDDLDGKFESLWLDTPPSPKYTPRPPVVITKEVIKELPAAPPPPEVKIVEKVVERVVEKPVEKKVVRRVVIREKPEPKPVVVPKPKPTPKPTVPVQERFSDLEEMVKLVVKKIRHAYFISGQSGSAKSHTVMYTLDQMGLVEGKDWFLAKGTASPAGIYSTLYRWNGKLIVFDDSDQAFQDKLSKNLLKSGLDSLPVRRICWITHTNFDPENKTEEQIKDLVAKGKLPKYFDFTGGIIFISNLPFEKVDSAIKTRCLVQDIQLTQEEMFGEMQRRINAIAPNVDLALKQKVLDLLKVGYKNSNKEISFRTFVTAITLASNKVDNWENLVTRYG